MPTEVFEHVLKSYVRELEEIEQIEGALISGSYVTGRLGPYSDLDLYLLVTKDSPISPGWSTIEREGVEIELTAHTFAEYEEIVRERSQIKDIVHPLSVGSVLFDRRGQFDTLLASAKACINDLSKRSELDSSQTQQSARRALVFGFRKIGNAFAINDDERFRYELGFALHLIPSLLLKLRNVAATSDPLGNFALSLPDLHRLYAQCLKGGSISELWERYGQFMRRTFKDFSLGKLPVPLWPVKGRYR